MKSFFISDALNSIDQKVTLQGWADTIRDHKKVIFIDLRDSSGKIQCVAFGPTVDISRSITPESVLKITGVVHARPDSMINPDLPLGSIELAIDEIAILSEAQTLPFEINKPDLGVTLPVLLDNRSLTLRHAKVRAIFKIQEVVVDAFRKALQEKNFTEFQAPILIPEIAEGGSEVFEVPYFDYKAYLSQSPQFYKQIMVSVFEKVFTVTKIMRAEPSVTTRHLTEATALDVEVGFIDSWTDVVDLAEYTIKYVISQVAERCPAELALHNCTLPDITQTIPRIKLREGQQIIFERTGRDNRQEPDLEPEDERELCRWAQETHNIDLVFVSHYPKSKRPFYHFEDPEDPGYTLGFDLLGHGVEWLTGGQRIHDVKLLLHNAQERGVDIEKSDLYMQAFKYGMPPEGGFSFGCERIVMNLLDLKNVREAALFPRDMERIDVHLPTLYAHKKSD